MIGFLALLLINAVLFVAGQLLIPPPKIEDATPEDPKGPRSEEGDVIPVVFGTVRLAANVTSFSNTRAVEQKEKIKVSVFSSRNVTTGFSYEALMQVLLCHGPIDELIDIVWQDTKSIGRAGESTGYALNPETGAYAPEVIIHSYTQPALPILRGPEPGGISILINAPDLFGGVKHGGGVVGPVQFYWGLWDQIADGTLRQEWSPTTQLNYSQDFLPKYEGIAHMVLGLIGANPPHDIVRFNFGEFGNVPPLHILVRRCPSNLGLSGAQTNINGGANIAEMAYEMLTNTVWGMAVPSEFLDVTSFHDAGVILAAEGLGLNMSMTSQNTGDSSLTELMRYCDGQIQQHPITGLIEFTLNRDDYVFEALPVINESAGSGATLVRPGWSDLKNEIKVIYTKVVNGVMKQVPTQPVQDIAAQRNFGAVNAETVQYPAVTDPVVANKLASRDLWKTSTPLAQIRGLQVDRRAADFRVGKPFVYSSERYGIAHHVFRVASADYGTLNDGRIVIDAIEDIFALGRPFYGDPVDLGIDDPTYGSLGVVKVTPVVTSDRTTGYLELILEGGGGRVTAVEFQEQSGNGVVSEWHENIDNSGFKTEVDLDSKHISHIAWRVQGRLKDGLIGTLAEGEIEYPLSSQPGRPVLAFEIDIDTGSVTAIIDVDTDATNVKVAASVTHVPDENEVLLEDPIAVPVGETRVRVPGVIVLEPNERGYISAMALDENGNPSPIASILISFADAAVAPTLELIEVIPHPITGATVNISVRVISPLFLGGTLEAWLNHDGLENPEYDADPDGSVTTAATPDTFGPTDAFDIPGGTFLLFRDIRVHVSAGKRIFLEFTDANGVSSGQRSFFVNGGGGVIGPDGELLPGSLKNAEQFAATIAPIEVWPEPLPDRPDGTVVVNTSQGGKLYRRESGTWVPVVQAPDLEGLLTADQIADAQLTTAKFAAGLRPIRIVSSLPGAGEMAGDTVYNTLDEKLYRWTGSAWTSSVGASDVSGQILATQIADGAIEIGKFAATLRPVQFGSSLPVSGTTGDTFVLTTDNRLYRWTGIGWTIEVPTAGLSGQISAAQVAAGAITAGKLSADAVTAGTIAAGAITARELAAESITASKIAIGFNTGAALNSDPYCRDINAWAATPPGSVSQSGSSPVGGLSLWAYEATIVERYYFNYDPNRTYRVRLYTLNKDAADGQNFPLVDFLDSSGVSLYLLDGQYWYFGNSAPGLPSDVWTLHETVFGFSGAGFYNKAIPAGAVSMRIGCLLNLGKTVGYVHVADPRIEEVLPGTLIKDGAITTAKVAALAIDAGRLAAGAVTAGKIFAGAVSTTELAADAVTAGKIAANQVITSHMAANSINGDRIAVNTLNAGKITSGTITSNELGVNSVIAGKIAAGAINTSAIVVNGAITGVKISIGSLQELTQNLGIMLFGRLNGPSGFYLDLGATGSNPVLHATFFDIFASGSASFSGTLSAATGTFAGDISATTGTFSGTVGASSFTSSLITMSANDAKLRFTSASSGAGLRWEVSGQTAHVYGYYGATWSLVIASTGRIEIVYLPSAGLLLNGSQVSVGANDSAGSGYKYLRVPNAATI